jgi:hypothetical protein
MGSGPSQNGRQYLITHFASQGGQVEWRVRPRSEDPGHPAGAKNALRPFFWLPGEPYVFLTGESCCHDEPPFFTNGRSLYRLNLETGQFLMISSWGQLAHFSFSPSGKYLLIARNGDHLVSVTRLVDGQAVRIYLPETHDAVGNAQWAPDGLHVLLRACDRAQGYSCYMTPIIVIDPEKPEFQFLVYDLYQALDMGEGDVEVISWKDETHIILGGPEFALIIEISTDQLEKYLK